MTALVTALAVVLLQRLLLDGKVRAENCAGAGASAEIDENEDESVVPETDQTADETAARRPRRDWPDVFVTHGGKCYHFSENCFGKRFRKKSKNQNNSEKRGWGWVGG